MVGTMDALDGAFQALVDADGFFAWVVGDSGELGDLRLAVGVDRIDYTKGLTERFRAVARFFERCPNYRGQFTFVQLGAPSRTHIPRYRNYISELEALADDINWRRFFDINELGGLRVERAVVFEATHAKLFELIERGLVDGLRIDHIDGLADPRGYCRKLRRRVDGLLHPGGAQRLCARHGQQQQPGQPRAGPAKGLQG